jgi:hypothetical protein
VGPPIKKHFLLFIFGFLVLTGKTLVLAGGQPPALRRFVLAQGRWRPHQQRPLLPASTNRLWSSGILALDEDGEKVEVDVGRLDSTPSPPRLLPP